MRKKLFGRGMVILLESGEIRIAQMNLGAAAPQIQYSAVLPTPEGAVDDGYIIAPDPLLDCLRDALSVPELNRVRNVVFSLCSTQVLSEVVTVPNVPRRKLERLLYSNMDIYFPVDTQDYHLVWTVVGPTVDESGTPASLVRLWAVPKTLVGRYYRLANALGLSVEAIDYCGNSLVSAVGASFTQPAAQQKRAVRKALPMPGRKKKGGRRLAPVGGGAAPDREENLNAGSAVALLESAPEGETTLCLTAEPDFLLMTFVRDGQVKLQRMVQHGGDRTEEFSEIQMAVEFYRSMPEGQGSGIRVSLCGALATEEAYTDQLERTLGMELQVRDDGPGPEWCLCVGAAQTKLDFGIPSLNQPRGSLAASQAVQYGLILGGGLLLVGSLVLSFGSRAVWRSELNGLESNRDALQIQSAQGAGNAQNYRDYAAAYADYSSDWDSVFDALMTYNDNLVLVFNELETLLPTTASVTEIGIAEEGISLQLACQSKEEAAYVLLTLRYSLQYGTLDTISDVTVGPGMSAVSVLPSLAAQQEALQEQTEEEQGSESGTSTEPPPTEGSQYDLSSLLQIMQQAAQGSGSSDYTEILSYALRNGLITESDLRQAIESLTPEQLAALEAVYGVDTENSYDLDELLASATLSQRESAIRNMLTQDPMAVYLFLSAFREDMQRPAGQEILFAVIYDDLWKNLDAFEDLTSGDLDAMRAAVPTLLDILTRNEETVIATENLIQTDATLSEKLAYYLSLEMGLDVSQGSGSGSGSIDVGQIIEDMVNGNLPQGNSALDDAISSLIPGLEDNGMDADDIMQILQGAMGGSGSGLDLGSLLGGGSVFDPGGQQAQTVDDSRIYVTVTIRYNESLRQVELERKGLSEGAKLEELEVAP